MLNTVNVLNIFLIPTSPKDRTAPCGSIPSTLSSERVTLERVDWTTLRPTQALLLLDFALLNANLLARPD